MLMEANSWHLKTEFISPLPSECKLSLSTKIVDLLDGQCSQRSSGQCRFKFGHAHDAHVDGSELREPGPCERVRSLTAYDSRAQGAGEAFDRAPRAHYERRSGDFNMGCDDASSYFLSVLAWRFGVFLVLWWSRPAGWTSLTVQVQGSRWRASQAVAKLDLIILSKINTNTPPTCLLPHLKLERLNVRVYAIYDCNGAKVLIESLTPSKVPSSWRAHGRSLQGLVHIRASASAGGYLHYPSCTLGGDSKASGPSDHGNDEPRFKLHRQLGPRPGLEGEIILRFADGCLLYLNTSWSIGPDLWPAGNQPGQKHNTSDVAQYRQILSCHPAVMELLLKPRSY
ncbi:hypothetical protein BDN72DRAFT_853524 [Pluteus cervinus]|uniref:Uncharacterized protein n=1 Tax=Pluteus cervinus TaxID=181527 RepID=A0ACD3BAQ0_9AGAR|nr:hypothetical protein BDN72DRAFT_853524 [Pluteus cervinus]